MCVFLPILRLQALVQASIRLFRCTLLPDASNCGTIPPTKGIDGVSHTDPLSLYLRSGQSMKIVGVRTPEYSPEACGSQAAVTVTIPTTSKPLPLANKPSPVSVSATLDSYRSGKDYMSNAYYLSHLLPVAPPSAAAATVPAPVSSTAAPTIAAVFNSERLTYSPMRAKLQLTLLSTEQCAGETVAGPCRQRRLCAHAVRSLDPSALCARRISIGTARLLRIHPGLLLRLKHDEQQQ